MHPIFRTITIILLLLVPLGGTEQVRIRSIFEDNINHVFADDGQADVRVVFGYDSRGDRSDPTDPDRARRFITYLLGRSFTERPRNPELASELGVRPDMANLHVFDGPGSPGQTLRVSLVWSSLTPKTAQNIGSRYIEQNQCSYDALKFMQKAAAESEVMVYLGHSRGGGGPDTFPPETVPGIKGSPSKIDYSYYRENRPGVAALGPYFARAGANPQIIALTSCYTENHFRHWLSGKLSGKRTPTSLVLSTRITQHLPSNEDIGNSDEGLMVLVSMIEALQRHPAQSSFEQRLKACEIDTYRNPNKPAWKLITLAAKTGKAQSVR